MSMTHRDFRHVGIDRHFAALMAAGGADPSAAYPLSRDVVRQGFQRGGIDFREDPTAKAHDSDCHGFVDDIATDGNHTETLNPQDARAK